METAEPVVQNPNKAFRTLKSTFALIGPYSKNTVNDKYHAKVAKKEISPAAKGEV